MHRHVSELTGITQQQMDLGMPLPQAAESFRAFCGEDFAFLTWGPDDIPMLKDNLHAHGLETGWLDRTYDLQVIFNRQTDNGTKQRSLEYAMDYYHIEQTLPAHDALNDAYFTALVAAKMDTPEGIRTYDTTQGKYLESSVHGDADAGDDGYVTVPELLADKQLTHPVCPVCGGTLSPLEKSLHIRGQRYLYLYRCEKDGDLLLTLRVRRNLNETWRAAREIRHASEEDIAQVRQKLAEATPSVTRAKSRSRHHHHRKKPAQNLPSNGQNET